MIKIWLGGRGGMVGIGIENTRKRDVEKRIGDKYLGWGCGCEEVGKGGKEALLDAGC